MRPIKSRSFLPQFHLLSAIPYMPLAIKRVCVMYANFKTQRGVLESGFLRFFVSVELHENGPVREANFAKLLPREQTHVGAEAGIGVLMKIDKAIDIRSNPIM